MNVDLHRALIDRFYRAFQSRDGAAMAACYHPEATFRDPVFDLRGERIGAMWTMLTSRSKDLRLDYDGVSADTDTGRANWQAWYTFTATGRSVHNIIAARFAFREGLILEHVDSFGFWRWARQALGPAGLLLGWTPMLHNKVRREAARTLAKFVSG